MRTYFISCTLYFFFFSSHALSLSHVYFFSRTEKGYLGVAQEKEDPKKKFELLDVIGAGCDTCTHSTHTHTRARARTHPRKHANTHTHARANKHTHTFTYIFLVHLARSIQLDPQ